MWSYAKRSIENSPFQVVHHETRDCQFGQHYFKKRERTSSRSYLQGTRKVNCPARIQICEYKFYPEFAISKRQSDDLSRKQLRLLREKKLSALKHALSINEDVLIKTKYFISLPTGDSHEEFHPTGIVCGPAQKVHPLISKKIEDLVREGAVDANEVQRSLREYVKNDCSIFHPSVTDRAYYPTVSDIRNHMYKARIALQLSKFDQENLTLKMKVWEELNQGDSHFFRPYIKKNCEVEEHPDEIQLDQSLL